jgi:hypothetical protein
MIREQPGPAARVAPQTLSAWRALFGPPADSPAPRSTEGGQGRALPIKPWSYAHEREDDWVSELGRLPDPGWSPAGGGL